MSSSYEPTFKETIKSTINRNAPMMIGTTLQLIMRGFITGFRFVTQLVMEALGKR